MALNNDGDGAISMIMNLQGEEPCMAVIDGKWHDTSCHNRFVWIGIVLNVNYNSDDNLGDDYHLLHRRSIVCEDLPAQNIQFVRNENPNVRIP